MDRTSSCSQHGGLYDMNFLQKEFVEGCISEPQASDSRGNMSVKFVLEEMAVVNEKMTAPKGAASFLDLTQEVEGPPQEEDDADTSTGTAGARGRSDATITPEGRG